MRLHDRDRQEEGDTSSDRAPHRLTDKQQLKPWPDWRHFGFLTDLDATAVEFDKFHRQHAVVELAIRDLKEGAGLEHVPSGNFHANSAWLQCAVLAHNMVRWTAIACKFRVENQLVVARTLRTRLLAIPGRLVNRFRTTNPTNADHLAMGHFVHASTGVAERTATRPRLTQASGQARRTTSPPSADNTTHHDCCSNAPQPSTTPDPTRRPSMNCRGPAPTGPVGGSRFRRRRSSDVMAEFPRLQDPGGAPPSTALTAELAE